MNRQIPLRPTFVCLTLSLLVGCADSTGTASQSEAGSDAPATDSPADAPATDALIDSTACASEADVESCCCDGDVQASPTCGSDGVLSCAAGYGLYHGADCSCSTGHGPCCIAMDAPADTADAPLTDGSLCVSPQVLRYETAGCGAAAHPICGSSDQDACLEQVCGCDGTTLSKCDYAPAPWSHLGPCSDAGEGGTDATDQ